MSTHEDDKKLADYTIDKIMDKLKNKEELSPEEKQKLKEQTEHNRIVGDVKKQIKPYNSKLQLIVGIITAAIIALIGYFGMGQ